MQASNQVSFEQFDEVYQKAVTEVTRFWTPEMQKSIAKHNVGWANYDFHCYLQVSSRRFYRAFKQTYRGKQSLADWRILDVGGFWGVYALTLVRLGCKNVHISEAKQYYNQCFDPLFEYLESCEITIVDYDPFIAGNAIEGCYDAIYLQAILEHYPHSPQHVFQNLLPALDEDGLINILVPNIAYWPKRWQLLRRGKTPLTPIREINQSSTPFTGHHHEYTMEELEYLASVNGLHVCVKDYLNYADVKVPWHPRELKAHIENWIFTRFPNTRHMISITASKKRLALQDRLKEQHIEDALDEFGNHENSYCHQKRVCWMIEHLDEGDCVVELGCGTGYMITRPLHKLGFDVRGYDQNGPSIALGQDYLRSENEDATIIAAQDFETHEGRIDAIVVSEVFNYMDNNTIDHHLKLLYERLDAGGKLLITVPNKWSCYKFETIIMRWNPFKKKFHRLSCDLLNFKHRYGFVHKPYAILSSIDTSPHVQCFSFGRIQKRLTDAGFEVVDATGSGLFSGNISELWLTGNRLGLWLNKKLGSWLPRMASGFYVCVRKPKA